MKPPKPSRSGANRTAPGTLHIKWEASLSQVGPYPTPQKRFFKLETFMNAFEKCVQEQDRFVFTGIAALSGDSSVSSLHCDLIYEDAVRLVFALTLCTRTRKRLPARLVVAKNHEECSAALEKECMALLHLARRCPEKVACPVRYGAIFLPDRHKRKDVNREVFAYFHKAPAELLPLYVASPRQLAPHGPAPLRYSIKETDQLKGHITALLAACYDDESMVGANPEQLTPECFAVANTNAREKSVMLIQCPRLKKKFRSGQFIESLLFGTLRTGRTVLPIAPEIPDSFFDVLAGAVTADKAREWCMAFFKRHDKFSNRSELEPDINLPGSVYLEALRASVNR